MHAVFAQQMSSFARQGFFSQQFKVSWAKEKTSNKVNPIPAATPKLEKKVVEIEKLDETVSAGMQQGKDVCPPALKRKDTLVPRPPCPGISSPTPIMVNPR